MTKEEFIEQLKVSANIAVQRANKFLGQLDLSLHINWKYEDWEYYGNAIGIYERDSVLEGNISIGFNIDNLYKWFVNEIKENPSERYKIKLLKKPTRKKPVQTSILQYPRNPHEMLAAKHRSGWKCCYDSSHKTFISENEHKNFVEGHHLIPMQHQCDFEYTIDFADNIIPLCPNCHRRIHFAIKQDRNRMLEKFYFERIDDIKVHGIDISIDELESYYV